MKITTLNRNELISNIIDTISSAEKTPLMNLIGIYINIHSDDVINDVSGEKVSTIKRNDMWAILEHYPDHKVIYTKEYDERHNVDLHEYCLCRTSDNKFIAESGWHENETDASDSLFFTAVKQNLIVNVNGTFQYPRK